MNGDDYLAQVNKARNEYNFLVNALEDTGWYSPGGVFASGGRKGTGKPQTVQERDFIIDFLRNYGRAPNMDEIAEWKTSPDAPDRTKYEYLPGSTMYELGFRGFDDFVASRYGMLSGGYGPYTGSLVPEGGVVTTKDGQPAFRTYYPEDIRRYTESGQMIPPESEGAEQYYPKYDRTIRKPQTPEEALSFHSPQDVYSARIQDYLSQQIDRDVPRIAELNNSYKDAIDKLNQQSIDGEIDDRQFDIQQYNLKKEYEEKLSTLMTEDRAIDIYQDAIGRLNKGYRVETLPLWGEIQGIIGPKTTELLNQGLKEFEKREMQRIKDIPEFRGYPSEQPQDYHTGNEQRQFYNYVESLDTTNEWKNYLKERYWQYFGMWEQNPTEPFVSWFIKAVGG